MFRFEIDAAARQAALTTPSSSSLTSSSSGCCINAVHHLQTPWRLFRNRIFKGEPLVPLCQTAFAMLIVPIRCSATEAGAAAANNSTTTTPLLDPVEAQLHRLINELEQLPPSTQSSASPLTDSSSPPWSAVRDGTLRFTAFYDDVSPSMCVLVDASSSVASPTTTQKEPSAIILDLLDRIGMRQSSCRRTSAPEAVQKANTEEAPDTQGEQQQHPQCTTCHKSHPPTLFDGALVAVPCDPRPLDECLGMTQPADGQSLFWSEYYELPTCLVCLDRIDINISGISRMCACDPFSTGDRGGVLSCQCSARLEPCRVCRHLLVGGDSTAPSSPTTVGMTDPSKMPPCEECGDAEESWCCLTCGRIGCGRYRREHAKNHFLSTHHEFTVSLVTQQVWDYTADCFVHRWLMRYDRESGSPEKMTLPGQRISLEASEATMRKLGIDFDVEDQQQRSPPSPTSTTGTDPHSPSSAGNHQNSNNNATMDDNDASLDSTPVDQQQRRHRKNTQDLLRSTPDKSSAPNSANFPSRTGHKTLVDAKLDFKMEKLCMDYSRELAVHLEAQRIYYKGLISEAASASGPAARPPPTNTANSRSRSVTPQRNQQQQQQHRDPTPPTTTSTTLSLSNEKDIQSLMRAMQNNVAASKELSDLYRRQDELMAERDKMQVESDRLKAQVKKGLESKTKFDKALKERIEELREGIKDMRGNLKVQSQAKKAGGGAGSMGVMYFEEKPTGGNKKGRR